MSGIPTTELSDDDLFRELGHLLETRLDTLRHGSDDAVAAHTERTRTLEEEYLRRRPQREIDPGRLRSGARERG